MVYWSDLFLQLPPYSFSFFFFFHFSKILVKMPSLQILLVKTGRWDHKKPISTVSSHCHTWIAKCGVLHGIPIPPSLVLNTQTHFTGCHTCSLIHYLKYIQETHRCTPLQVLALMCSAHASVMAGRVIPSFTWNLIYWIDLHRIKSPLCVFQIGGNYHIILLYD